MLFLLKYHQEILLHIFSSGQLTLSALLILPFPLDGLGLTARATRKDKGQV